MIIEITDKYRISGSDDAWLVQRLHTHGPDSLKAGESTWRTLTYHMTLEHAGKSLADRIKRTTNGAFPVPEAVVAIAAIDALVTGAIEASNAAWGEPK